MIHYARITHLIEEHDIQRMVIDGMTSYSTAIGEVAVYRDFFHAIVAYSKQRLMTTFFNYENPEFLRVSSYMPDFPVSSIVDNLILMTLVEINNSLHRCISVVKTRGSEHSFANREFVICQGGIQLVLLEENLDALLPLQSSSSLLSRAPTRLSLPKRINGAQAHPTSRDIYTEKPSSPPLHSREQMGRLPRKTLWFLACLFIRNPDSKRGTAQSISLLLLRFRQLFGHIVAPRKDRPCVLSRQVSNLDQGCQPNVSILV